MPPTFPNCGGLGPAKISLRAWNSSPQTCLEGYDTKRMYGLGLVFVRVLGFRVEGAGKIALGIQPV